MNFKPGDKVKYVGRPGQSFINVVQGQTYTIDRYWVDDVGWERATFIESPRFYYPLKWFKGV